MKIEHHRTQVYGARLHYLRAGQGDPIVLLHGYPQTSHAWRKVIPLLASNYTVIAPDLRGLGDSSRPSSGYDKRTIAEDIYQLVQELGFEQIFLVGHDLGGMVAYAYAAAHPRAVRRLVMAEMLLPGLGLEPALDFSKPGSGYIHMALNMTPDLPEALIAGKERLYITYLTKPYCYNPESISTADLDEYLRCYASPGGMKAGFEYYRSFFQDVEHNQENAKTKLSMPTLALGGDMSLGDYLHQTLIPLAEDVRGTVIKQCGHFIPEEQPEQFVEVLKKFFMMVSTSDTSNALDALNP
jgi:pimeloyl-ACP methyl ester carboxylesterase